MGFYIFTFTLHRLYYIVIQMIAMKDGDSYPIRLRPIPYTLSGGTL